MAICEGCGQEFLTNKLRQRVSDLCGTEFGLVKVPSTCVHWTVVKEKSAHFLHAHVMLENSCVELKNLTQIFAVRECEGVIYTGNAPLVEGMEFSALNIPFTDHINPVSALAELVYRAVILGVRSDDVTGLKRSMAGIYDLGKQGLEQITVRNLGILREVVEIPLTNDLGTVYITELTLIAY
jgi:hypothetical protein